MADGNMGTVDDGLQTAYRPPMDGGDPSAIMGQGFGYAPFRAARTFRVLTGAMSAVGAYAGQDVVEFSDGSDSAETTIGRAFTQASGGTGYPASESILATGTLSDAETMTIVDDTSTGIARKGSHFKIRGLIVRPILGFTLLPGATSIKARRSDAFFRERSDGGPSLREELAEQVMAASYVIIKDQQSVNSCRERLGNLGMWREVDGGPRSDSFWYLELPFSSGGAGSDSVEVSIVLASKVTIAARGAAVPLDAGVPAFKVCYGFEVVLVGEPALGAGAPMSFCAPTSGAGSREVAELRREVSALTSNVNKVLQALAAPR